MNFNALRRSLNIAIPIVACLAWSGLAGADPALVGIAGGSASGKTTLTKGLAAVLGERGKKVCVLSQDRYFDLVKQDPAHHVVLDRSPKPVPNFDHPTALNFARMEEDLETLLKGESAMVPAIEYTQVHSGKTEPLGPCEVILFEGIHAFYSEKLIQAMKFRIFVKHPEEHRIKRRVERDERERNSPPAETMEFFTKMVKPMHDEHIEPRQKIADRIVSGSDTRDLRCLNELVGAILNLEE